MSYQRKFVKGDLYEYEGHLLRYWGIEVNKPPLKTSHVLFEVRTDRCYSVPIDNCKGLKRITS